MKYSRKDIQVLRFLEDFYVLMYNSGIETNPKDYKDFCRKLGDFEDDNGFLEDWFL
jgi:hypothetical protein|tara:strand:+ start:642 stop:809 length:168 start_codon:yes stop_codon:yes gene_type:complete